MDWSTNLIVRALKDPPEKGGWNLLHTFWNAADVINPAVHFGVSGAGPRAWFGWPEIPEIEKLVTDWVRESDEAKRLRLADEIQRVAFSEVPYEPWGQMVSTDRVAKKRPRRPEIRRADFLEREARINLGGAHALRVTALGSNSAGCSHLE